MRGLTLRPHGTIPKPFIFCCLAGILWFVSHELVSQFQPFRAGRWPLQAFARHVIHNSLQVVRVIAFCPSSCAICLRDRPTREQATRLPCGHLYCPECIAGWLGNRCTCPVCRYELQAGDVIDKPGQQSQADLRA